jgi:DNA-binding response OmpR family regulator
MSPSTSIVFQKNSRRVEPVSRWTSVLVIEDEELVRRALKRSLTLYGFKAHFASDGPSGVQLAREQKPAFILLDWMMPEMDGLEVLSELKHGEQTEHIPVFMLTGKGLIGEVDQAFEIGADGYITKPSDLAELGRIAKARWEKYKKSRSVA